MAEYLGNRRARVIAGAAALCVAFAAGHATAEGAAAFYKDKTVRFFATGGPGGGAAASTSTCAR